MANVVEVKNVTKRFTVLYQNTMKSFLLAFLRRKKIIERRLVLKNISFEVKQGETVGIIGQNGQGKSTLLRIIAGSLVANSGQVVLKAHQVAPLLSLGSGFDLELTGRENIELNSVLLGTPKKEVSSIIEKVIKFAEIRKFIDMPIKFYSTGMVARLGFSTAMHIPADLFLIDEVLSVGDVVFREKALARLKQRINNDKVSTIIVSHNTPILRQICKRILVLHNTEIVYDGPANKAIKVYERICAGS